MKKILITVLFLFLMTFYTQYTKASEYTSYQDIEPESQFVYMLDDFTKSMYKTYYSHIDNRQFWGWRIYEVNTKEKVTFTKETLMVILNEGDTPITDTFKVKSEESMKKQYNVSGSIDLKSSGDAYGVKLGFEQKIDYSITKTTSTKKSEEITIKINVDPGTKLLVQIVGEGKITNGVGKYYRFWRTKKKGGWEIFVLTTEYYSIKKEYINEE